MKTISTTEENRDLVLLCGTIRTLLKENAFTQCERLIAEAMGKHPHAPEPHNLFGVIFEKEGQHIEAMKHFRAAWALDPTYVPARCNMEHYTGFYGKRPYALDETDCAIATSKAWQIQYDEHGIGRVVGG